MKKLLSIAIMLLMTVTISAQDELVNGMLEKKTCCNGGGSFLR